MEVNGKVVAGIAEHRLSVADFLRENLGLTGTRLGCEQGVCGACTIEIDGDPSRSCITLAHACNGAKIRTIEAYDDDVVMQALREAFSEFHGLQCGFCTPGFLVASREIVVRKLANDEATIRLALGGNLCRCTGYVGIVSAVKDVLSKREELLAQSTNEKEPVKTAKRPSFPEKLPQFERRIGKLKESEPENSGSLSESNNQLISERIKFKHSLDAVWEILGNMETMVSCVPGARVINSDGEKFKLEMQSSFGAISARFLGDGHFVTDSSEHLGQFSGTGSDARSGSGASGQLSYRLIAADQGCWLELQATYNITGPLAQFSRGGLVKSFATAIIAMFIRNIERILDGEDIASGQATELSVVSLVWRVVKHRFSRLFKK